MLCYLRLVVYLFIDSTNSAYFGVVKVGRLRVRFHMGPDEGAQEGGNR